MQTLVVTKSFKTFILTVELVETTEKALKFQLVDNKKCYVYLPKCAVTKNTWEGFTDYTVKRWFKGSEYFWSMFTRYGQVFNA